MFKIELNECDEITKIMRNCNQYSDVADQLEFLFSVLHLITSPEIIEYTSDYQELVRNVEREIKTRESILNIREKNARIQEASNNLKPSQLQSIVNNTTNISNDFTAKTP